jgi:hypothetical protein
VLGRDRGGGAGARETGDIVLFPQGDAHVLSSAPGMRAPIEAASYVERKQNQLPRRQTLPARAS